MDIFLGLTLKKRTKRACRCTYISGPQYDTVGPALVTKMRKRRLKNTWAASRLQIFVIFSTWPGHLTPVVHGSICFSTSQLPPRRPEYLARDQRLAPEVFQREFSHAGPSRTGNRLGELY